MAEEVGLGYPVYVLYGQLPDGAGGGDARVADHYIDLAKGLQRGVQQGLYARSHGRVGHEGCALGALGLYHLHGLGEAGSVYIVYNHLHAALGGLEGYRAAYAAARAGDRKYLTLEFLHRCSPPLN